MTLTITLNNKRKELNDKIAENYWLADFFTADSENITFFDSNEGKYSYELRQCIYDLFFLKVSASNCSNVIRSVLNVHVPTLDASYLKAKEFGTARLVRTAYKVFSRGGDETK